MFRNASVGILWELKTQLNQGTITCIDCYEFNEEDHLLVGRQSGSVEVYSLNSVSVPIEKYKYVILIDFILPILTNLIIENLTLILF